MHQAKMKKQGFIKNKVMIWLVVASVDKNSQIPHTDVISLTFEEEDGDNVWQVWNQHHLMLLTIFVPLSPSMQVALVNGHFKAIFASIKLLLYWCVLTLQQRISLSIAARIMEPTMVDWNACLLTRHTYNWMMVHLMMGIATKIQLMRLALLTLGGLQHGWR